MSHKCPDCKRKLVPDTQTMQDIEPGAWYCNNCNMAWIICKCDGKICTYRSQQDGMSLISHPTDCMQFHLHPKNVNYCCPRLVIYKGMAKCIPSKDGLVEIGKSAVPLNGKDVILIVHRGKEQ